MSLPVSLFLWHLKAYRFACDPRLSSQLAEVDLQHGKGTVRYKNMQVCKSYAQQLQSARVPETDITCTLSDMSKYSIATRPSTELMAKPVASG